MSLLDIAKQKGMTPSGRTQTIQNSKPETSTPGGFNSYAVGAGKGIFSTLTGISSLGERGIKALGRVVTPKPLEKAFGFQKEDKMAAEQLVPEGLRTPQNTKERIGFGAEQVAEFLAPGATGEKIAAKSGELAANLVEKTGILSKVVQKTVPLATKIATEGLFMGGQTALQQGKLNSDVALNTVIGAAFPLAGAIAKPIASAGAKAGLEFLGKTTGAGSAAIKEAFKNPVVMQIARQAGVDGVEGLQKKAVETATTGLNLIKKARGKAYEAALNTIKLDKTQMDDIALNLRNKVRDMMGPDEYNINFGENAKGKLNALDFATSTITEGTAPIERAVNDVMGWTDWTAAGLDKLKKRVGAFLDQTPYKSPSRAFLYDMKSTLDQQLKQNVKGYEEMTSGYREASDLIDEIQSNLSLGGKAQVQTTVNKLMSTLKQNFEMRNELLGVLSKASGEDITGQLSGAALSPLAPKGIVGALGPTAGVLAAVTNPAHWPLILMSAAASSPRLVGELAGALGSISRKAGEAIEVTPGLKTLIERIFGGSEGSKPLDMVPGAAGETIGSAVSPEVATKATAVTPEITSGAASSEIAVTSFRGTPVKTVAETEPYFLTTRAKGFENGLDKSASDFGVKVDNIRKVAGSWEGSIEPSFSAKVKGSLEDKLAYAAQNAKKANQDAVIVFTKGEGTGVRYSFKGLASPDEALTKLHASGISGATVDGNEIRVYDLDGSLADKLAVFSKEAGVTPTTTNGTVDLIFKDSYDKYIGTRGGVGGGVRSADATTSLDSSIGGSARTSGTGGEGVVPKVEGAATTKTAIGKFEPAKDLPPEDRSVETKAFDKISKDETKILADYKKTHGNVVNADDFRPLFKDAGYNGSNAAAVQESASYLAKKAYTAALKNDGKFATYTSGMSGAGKTSALNDVPLYGKVKDNSAVILDSNLSSYDSAVKKFKQAQDAGKKLQVFYVYRDPMDGFENGVVKRMVHNEAEMGRIVPTKVVAENAKGSWEVAQRLKNEGFNVHFVDNSSGKGNVKVLTLDQMKKKVNIPSNLKEMFDKKAKELLDNTTINEQQYQKYIQ